MASRRSVLKAVLGSAVGASAVLTPALPAAAAAAPRTKLGRSLSEEATVTAARRLGPPSRDLSPVAGDRCVVVAGVALPGRPPGVLHADVVRLHDRSQLPEHSAAATLEQHVLVWDDGTLTASGVCDSVGVGSFAVTGGTGVYHDVAGSYELTIHRSDLGGDGTGRIAFHLTTTGSEA